MARASTAYSGYVASIDQGTSSSRFMIFDKLGNVIASHQMEHTQYYPSPGHVEHDPMEIWERVVECAREAMRKANITMNDLHALGITNQRETTVIWNRRTGKPYCNAIVWNDTRTSSICANLIATIDPKLGVDAFRAKTGLPINTYFSASKIMYLLDTVPGLRLDAEKGEAAFGTIDSWLIFKLTCGKVHATDATNASRTMLMDLATMQWDPSIAAALNIPMSMLPEIRSSSEVYGRVLSIDELLGVRIAGVLGDQQAALFGQGCFETGQVKCTYGTGAFLLLNTGSQIVPSTKGMLTTVAYKIGNDAPVYALEGSVAYCGSLIQWLRDNLELIDSAEASEDLLLSNGCQDNGGVYFVPAFSGLMAPHWRADARGTIIGLTAYNTAAHIVRAALEAAAFQVNDVLIAMASDSGVSLTTLRIDGGMTKNNTAMQFQCDLVNLPLQAQKIPESTALGAAYAAGLAVAYWPSLDAVLATRQVGRAWSPCMDEGMRSHYCKQWRKALSRALNWIEPGDQEQAAQYRPLSPGTNSASNANARRDPKHSIVEQESWWPSEHAACVAVGLALGALIGWMAARRR